MVKKGERERDKHRGGGGARPQRDLVKGSWMNNLHITIPRIQMQGQEESSEQGEMSTKPELYCQKECGL